MSSFFCLQNLFFVSRLNCWRSLWSIIGVVLFVHLDLFPVHPRLRVKAAISTDTVAFWFFRVECKSKCDTWFGLVLSSTIFPLFSTQTITTNNTHLLPPLSSFSYPEAFLFIHLLVLLVLLKYLWHFGGWPIIFRQLISVNSDNISFILKRESISIYLEKLQHFYSKQKSYDAISKKILRRKITGGMKKNYVFLIPFFMLFLWLIGLVREPRVAALTCVLMNI